jgi:hypothetical protein
LKKKIFFSGPRRCPAQGLLRHQYAGMASANLHTKLSTSAVYGFERALETNDLPCLAAAKLKSFG